MEAKALPSQAVLRKWFDYDPAGHLTWKIKPAQRILVGSRAGSPYPHGYISIKFDKVRYRAHRLIYVWHHGEIPDGLQVDHVDNNRSNNRIENLQLLTNQQNVSKGQARFKASGLPTNVVRRGQRFAASANGVYLGCFSSVAEAVAAQEAVK